MNRKKHHPPAPITDKQIRAIFAMASRLDLLPGELRRIAEGMLYRDVYRLEDLTRLEACRLFTNLRGRLDHRPFAFAFARHKEKAASIPGIDAALDSRPSTCSDSVASSPARELA